MAEPGYFDRLKENLDQTDADPRLDNRSGSDRAARVSDPAVPQQVDGPDLMHQADHAEAVARKAAAADRPERVGMFSPGDHSLGDYEERGGNHAGQADDRLETDPEAKNSASTDMADGEADVSRTDPIQAEGVAKALGGGSRSKAGRSETATAGPGERRSRTEGK